MPMKGEESGRFLWGFSSSWGVVYEGAGMCDCGGYVDNKRTYIFFIFFVIFDWFGRGRSQLEAIKTDMKQTLQTSRTH